MTEIDQWNLKIGVNGPYLHRDTENGMSVQIARQKRTGGEWTVTQLKQNGFFHQCAWFQTLEEGMAAGVKMLKGEF